MVIFSEWWYQKVREKGERTGVPDGASSYLRQWKVWTDTFSQFPFEDKEYSLV